MVIVSVPASPFIVEVAAVDVTVIEMIISSPVTGRNCFANSHGLSNEEFVSR